MPTNNFTPIKPDSFLHIGGFIGQRFQANRLGRLKDPILSEEFIRLHERKNYDGWFWLGLLHWLGRGGGNSRFQLCCQR